MAEKIDVVKLISDSYHEVSMTLAALLPNEEGYNQLEQKRAELGVRLDRLVREFFRDNTERFVETNNQLVLINKKMKKALRDLESMKNAIDAVTNLIKAVDGFIEAVFPVPA